MDLNNILLIGPVGINAFWVWFVFGLLLLGVEVFLGTQWLLWAAASAGVVAVVCLTGLPFGFFFQALTFALLSLAMGILTPKFMKVASHSADINDPHRRMVGKQAHVLSGFELVAGGERTGRVSFDGVEWPAVLDETTDTALAANDRVVIERIHEGRVFVRRT
ncbi:NfeD family protein [Asticcacaulis sp. 201]|uniref:NfeD family protein n=1 Tax=Asticcacaulis sp. 201 TaxID=3028787 RepID=UPI00291681E3|nr:NfeD family protein [Asticcacaulis sp. 201]MDV6332917.1 NfeD family protein [Asticcacaulis sp. 201]